MVLPVAECICLYRIYLKLSCSGFNLHYPTLNNVNSAPGVIFFNFRSFLLLQRIVAITSVCNVIGYLVAHYCACL